MADSKDHRVLEPRPVKGARALLFERLVDEQPRNPIEARPLRIHDEYSVRRSVQTELMRLLNTRCPGTRWPMEAGERTVLDYGIPDFSWMSAASASNLQELARIVERAIAAYEPRLRQVHVAIKASPTDHTAVQGGIQAMLVIGKVMEPISFPLVITVKAGVIELHD
jgi:type VI secretion system lysozyme-like protein